MSDNETQDQAPIEDTPTDSAADEAGDASVEEPQAETAEPDAPTAPPLAAVPDPPPDQGPPPTPEDAPERPPVDPSILGPLLPAELQTLMGMQQRLNGVATEIGHLEVRKAKLLGTVEQIEKQVQEGMEGVSERLQIPKGTVWTVGQDGMARLVPQNQIMGGAPGGPHNRR